MSEIWHMNKINPLIRALVGNQGSKMENFSNFANETANSILNSTFTNSVPIDLTSTTAKSSDLEIHRANFVWPEDPDEELPIK